MEFDGMCQIEIHTCVIIYTSSSFVVVSFLSIYLVFIIFLIIIDYDHSILLGINNISIL